jgi:hypothetical protein
MTQKIHDLQDARRKKRRSGWTMAEIEKRAAEEFKVYQKVAKDEPDNLASGGDMNTILDEPEDEDESK